PSAPARRLHGRRSLRIADALPDDAVVRGARWQLLLPEPAMTRTRVLVVDDSAFARKVVREVLSASPEIEVVGIARDGLEALEMIAEHRPDVVTLDLVMPNLDGIGVLRALPTDGPRVVVISISGAYSALGLEALELGAFDLVQKPTALATDQLYEVGRDLIGKVLAAARSGGRSAPAATISPAPRVSPRPVATSGLEAVVVGTST